MTIEAKVLRRNVLYLCGDIKWFLSTKYFFYKRAVIFSNILVNIYISLKIVKHLMLPSYFVYLLLSATKVLLSVFNLMI